MSLANFGVDRHVAALGIVFRAASLIVGIPAFAFSGYMAYTAYEMFSAPPGDSPDAYDPQGSISSLMSIGGSYLGDGLHLLAGTAAWLCSACAIFGLFTAIVACLVFWIGGAIGRRASWGRVCGFLFSFVVLLASSALLFLIATDPHSQPDLAYVAIPIGAASLYALWVLTFRFSPR